MLEMLDCTLVKWANTPDLLENMLDLWENILEIVVNRMVTMDCNLEMLDYT
jgi:hypothetical protein